LQLYFLDRLVTARFPEWLVMNLGFLASMKGFAFASGHDKNYVAPWQ